MRFFLIPPNHNTSQRSGILLLFLIIILLQFLYHFVDFSKNEPEDITTPDLLTYQKRIDSLKQIKLEKKKPRIYPFNPSFLTDYKGYQLGMSTKEIDRIINHRKKGKYINSVKEFQQISGVSDSLLATIAPYFKFPEWILKKRKKNALKNPVAKSTKPEKFNHEAGLDKKLDLNTATKADLIKIHGIGEKLASRIIKYRQKLHGYLIDEQLYEVWYLDKEVADRVLQRFTVINKPDITKININTASFKEVLHSPYMNYELTKKIFEYRDEMAEIQSLEELKKIEGFPIDKFDRISLYLTAE